MIALLVGIVLVAIAASMLSGSGGTESFRNGSTRKKDASGLVGVRGVAQETFSSEGKVLVSGELWRATPAQGIVHRGDQVIVEEVRPGLLLLVSREESVSNK